MSPLVSVTPYALGYRLKIRDVWAKDISINQEEAEALHAALVEALGSRPVFSSAAPKSLVEELVEAVAPLEEQRRCIVCGSNHMPDDDGDTSCVVSKVLRSW